MKKLILALLVILVAVLVVAFGWVRSQAHDLPELNPSAEADELARAMMESVNHDAWQGTGAVTWTFRGEHVHLWDRQRSLARVAWTEDADGPTLFEAFLDLPTFSGGDEATGEGIVLSTPQGGGEAVELSGDERDLRLQQAWSYFINDSFWLNPIAKLFDDGTSRGLVTPAEGDFDSRLRGLLVSYSSGGVTPGDSYLWMVGNDDRPVAWRMWTQILPIQGLETSWEGWQEVSSGAMVATRHQTPIGALGLSDVAGARTLSELLAELEQDGSDPFGVLAGPANAESNAIGDEPETDEAALP